MLTKPEVNMKMEKSNEMCYVYVPILHSEHSHNILKMCATKVFKSLCFTGKINIKKEIRNKKYKESMNRRTKSLKNKQYRQILNQSH